MNKKLAIVGSGSLTREQAPYKDESFDVWVFNEAPMFDWCKRWTSAFQIHLPEVYSSENVKSAGYWEWMQEPHGKEIIMKQEDSRVPDCTVYPLDDALALGGKFFGMTVCYAVALALLRGYKHIELWGIELSTTEYQYGVDTWLYWVGYAKGKLGNDHFILHCGEGLFEAPLYGYEGGANIDKSFFSERITYLDNGWKAADKHLQNIKTLFVKYVKENEYKKFGDLFIDFEKSAIEAGEFAGALAEAEKWIDYPVSRNEFELAAATAQRDGDNKRTLMLHNGGMVEYVAAVWEQSKGNKNAAVQLLGFVEKHLKLAYDTGALHGAFIENQSYMAKYDDMMLANGTKPKEVSTTAKRVLQCL